MSESGVRVATYLNKNLKAYLTKKAESLGHNESSYIRLLVQQDQKKNVKKPT